VSADKRAAAAEEERQKRERAERKRVEQERAEREERQERERAERERAEREAPDNECAARVLKYLEELLAEDAARDLATWRNSGGYEAEDFLDALATGRPHPLLKCWKQRKVKYRPPPSRPEQRVRNLVVWMCAALERASPVAGTKIRKGEARGQVARALAAEPYAFPGGPPSADTIREWQQAHGPFTSDDEKVVEQAIARTGGRDDEIVRYFLGLIRFALNVVEPARLVRMDKP
jgi:hypothetical protein